MGWFQRNSEFLTRSLAKSAGGASSSKVEAVSTQGFPCFKSYDFLGNPLLGTPDTVFDRRAREDAVAFHCGISSQTFGSKAVQKSAQEPSESASIQLRDRYFAL